MAFRNWILYTLWAKESKTRPDIIISLKRVFHPDNYIPVLSELKATFNGHYDFKRQFDDLIHPLKEYELLIEEIEEEYYLTEDGEKHLKKFISHFKYYDVHESDAILLAMAQNKKE